MGRILTSCHPWAADARVVGLGDVQHPRGYSFELNSWCLGNRLPSSVTILTVLLQAVSAQLPESARFVAKGFGRAFTTMLGNAIGAKSVVDAHRIMRAGVVTMIVGAPLYTLALGLLFKFVIRALTSDGNVEQKSVDAHFFILGFTFLDFVRPILTAFIMGLGLQANIGYMSTLISYLVGVPLCVVFVRVAYLGVSGIWLGLCCSYFLIDLLYAVSTCSLPRRAQASRLYRLMVVVVTGGYLEV